VFRAARAALDDYPSTLLEFEKRFATDDRCRAYLAAVRWPEGFRCPRCRSHRAWPRRAGGLFECAECRYKASATAGTIFDRTRLPLTVWFHAIWLLTHQKNGASALSLQRQLGLARYETTWMMLHKLRRAMVRPGRDRLRGLVEVDDTYIGGDEREVRGRETYTKALVAIAAEEQGEGMGRIRLATLPNASGRHLLAFVEASIEPGARVHTDGWEGFRGLKAKGYGHDVTNIKQTGEAAHLFLPRVHRVASLLKRWLLGTHQGGVRPIHLDYYLDEFTFRFNRRTSRSRGQLFYRLIQQAVEVEPVHWTNVAAGERRRRIHN
jgi:ribosomal protein L37AE/L43A/transposase-like protein